MSDLQSGAVGSVLSISFGCRTGEQIYRVGGCEELTRRVMYVGDTRSVCIEDITGSDNQFIIWGVVFLKMVWRFFKCGLWDEVFLFLGCGCYFDEVVVGFYICFGLFGRQYGSVFFDRFCVRIFCYFIFRSCYVWFSQFLDLKRRGGIRVGFF